jgi:MarR family transcriptional regulator, organic hydroperoxide resistance regulator
MYLEANSFSRAVSKFFDEQFREFNLAATYVELLLYVKQEGRVQQKDISEYLNMDPSTITRFIRKLEKEGWVEKKRENGRVFITVRQERADDLSRLSGLYISAADQLEEILGVKFIDTTEKLLEHGVAQIDRNSR